MEPAVLVGRAGVTDAVVKEVDDALEARELLKVRLPGDREERAGAAAAIAARTSSELAGQIGRIAILYRRNPDPARRKVDLPPD
jgi:RNA-binding protein